MSGRVAPVAPFIVPVVQDLSDLCFLQESVRRLFPLEPGVIGPAPSFLDGARSPGAGVPETIMPDLTGCIVGETLGDVGIEPTLLSEVSPLYDQR